MTHMFVSEEFRSDVILRCGIMLLEDLCEEAVLMTCGLIWMSETHVVMKLNHVCTILYVYVVALRICLHYVFIDRYLCLDICI